MDIRVLRYFLAGGGEADAMRLIAKIATKLQKSCPNIRYHLFSGNADDVTERLDKGLLDFGILIEPAAVFPSVETKDGSTSADCGAVALIFPIRGCHVYLYSRPPRRAVNSCGIEEGEKVYDFGIMLSGHGQAIKWDSSDRLIIITLLKKTCIARTY